MLTDQEFTDEMDALRRRAELILSATHLLTEQQAHAWLDRLNTPPA